MKFILPSAFLLLFGAGLLSFSESEEKQLSSPTDESQINWVDFETAVEANQTESKPFFIDMYTDWCGFCRKMDGTTFRETEVIDFLNENFHTVKLNPEKAASIAYKGNLYERKQYGKRSYNELAVNLLGGKMSFPTFVILSKKEVRLGTIPGYHSARDLIAKAKAIAKLK